MTDETDLVPIDLPDRAPGTPRRRRPRRSMSTFVAVAATALLAGAAARLDLSRLRWPPGEPGASGTIAAPGEWSWTGPVPGSEPTPPGWHRGSPGWLPWRPGAVAAWTGSELLVWGGGRGAGYDVTRGRWRRLPPAPMGALQPEAASAWTGRELLVWGARQLPTRGKRPAAGGAAYIPASDRWRMLPPAPLGPRAPLGGVWTDRELVVVGGTDTSGGPVLDGAAYDPGGDDWRAVPPMPVALAGGELMWTGDEVVVVGRVDGEHGPGGGDFAAMAYEPASDGWRVLASPPLEGRMVTAVWTGQEILAWDSDRRAVALDPLGSAGWRDEGEVPVREAGCDPVGVLAGEVVFAEHCGQAAVYRVATRRWQAVGHPGDLRPARSVWTGERLLFWTGKTRGTHDGLWLFRPPGPRPVGPVPPLRSGADLS